MTVTLFHNGTILTMDDRDTTPEAVCISGEKIVAVGRLQDLRQQYHGAVDHDLDGLTMLPAFIDPHGPFP